MILIIIAIQLLAIIISAIFTSSEIRSILEDVIIRIRVIYLQTNVSKYNHLMKACAQVHSICRGHHVLRYHGMLEYCRSH